MNIIRFRIQGRFGHFLRAEANASAPTYPVPPRTALLGLIGAVLGFPKDTPQTELEPAWIALSGSIPRTHWHKAKLRKDPPEALSWLVKRTQKLDKQTKPEKATLIAQEWLMNPAFQVWAALAEPYHSELESRLRERRWHFQPSLGLSELMADLAWEETSEAKNLPEGIYHVSTVFLRESGNLDMDTIFKEQLVLHALRMPRAVTPDRVFSHAAYYLERDARSVPLHTANAFKAGDAVIMFL
jgi:CRISPR-associated protein Cas5h